MFLKKALDKKNLILLLFFLTSLLSFSQEKQKLVIGVIHDKFTQNSAFMEKSIKAELINVLGNNYNVEFPDEKKLEVNSISESDLLNKLQILNNDNNIDMIIIESLFFSKIQNMNVKKPIFMPFAINEENRLNIKPQLENIIKFNKFNKVSFIIEKNLTNTFSQLDTVKNINIVYADENLNEKVKDSDAVIIGPATDRDKIKEMVTSLYKNKIPVFSFMASYVENYLLIGRYDYEKEIRSRARMTAFNISDYLKDNNKQNKVFQLHKEWNSEFFINMDAVEKIGIWPDWDALSEAKLTNFSSGITDADSKNLKEIIKIALENNPSIKALEKELEGMDINVAKAKSNYKPDINFDVTGAILDKYTAESIFSPAEKTINGSVTVTQVLFSEDANMNIDIQKKKKELKEAELEKAKLDLILEVIEAYMNVLKVQSYSRIQKENLELTRQNLDLVKAKIDAGVSSHADLLRLNSEFSKNLSSLIEVMLNVDIVKANLKRIMNYDINQDITIKDVTLADKDFITSNDKILNYISNKQEIAGLINYMLEQAILNSPDLKSIEFGIDIQKRLIENTRNKKFMPTVALQGKYTKNFIKEGIGSGNPVYTNLDYGDYSILGSFGPDTDQNWNVGINFSLPIYDGGELKANKNIAENSKDVMKYQKETTIGYLKQLISMDLYQVISEYSKINSAQISLESASKALDLVKDTYFNGISTVSDLIGAQSSLILAQQYKTTIVYDLLIAITKAERVTGTYYILKNDSEKENINKEVNIGGIAR